MGFIISGKE